MRKMIPDLVKELKDDFSKRGFQDFNHPLSVEDFGVDFSTAGRDYRYDILNGFHRFTAAKELGFKQVFCNIFKTENLDPVKRIMLQDNAHGHSRESSLGQVIKMMIRSFPNIFVAGLMNDFGLRLRLLLEKEPTTTNNWAQRYLKVCRFPNDLPDSYEYYQTDNRIDLNDELYKKYERLRDDICECLDRSWFIKVLPLFVELPELVDGDFYFSLLTHIKVCLETSKPVVTNSPNFGFDKLVNFLIGIVKIMPFALSYLKSRQVVPQDTQWRSISEFIDEHCRLQGIALTLSFSEKLDYLLGCISDRVILPLKNITSKQFNEQNPKIKSAVQAVCRLLLEKQRANPSEASTESVRYEVDGKKYTLKYNIFNLVTTINASFNSHLVMKRSTNLSLQTSPICYLEPPFTMTSSPGLGMLCILKLVSPWKVIIMMPL